MAIPKFKSIGSSKLSPIDNMKRKEILVPKREVAVSAPSCWLEDYQAEIFAPVQKYSSLLLKDGSEAHRIARTRYKLYVPLKSSSKVTVEVRFITQGGAMRLGGENLPLYHAEGMQDVVNEGLEAYWNRLFKIKITDPVCGIKQMDLDFRAIWLATRPEMLSMNTTGAAKEGEFHRKLIVYEDIERESVSNFVMELGLASNSYIAAHEFAHCLGIPDEYPTDISYGTLRYRRPDGTFDKVIKITEDKPKESKQSTVMSTAYSKNRLLPRHAWNIAIEVQELLTTKLGRKIACDII